MGLDITAYRQLKDERAGSIDDEDYDYKVESMLCPNPDFPGRAGSIDKDRVYSYAEKLHFRAGSYRGYGRWREWLATEVAGFESLSAAWAATSGPFWELVSFSDCEGVIAGDVARKLLTDFVEHQAKAEAKGGEYLEIYNDFRKAFAMAADGGAVDFH
jgi:hypothetical protein